MNSKRFIRIVAIILAVIMLFSVLMIALDALAGSTASARVTQETISQLREEKRDIERRKSEVNARINTIEFNRMEQIDKKEILDSRITLTGEEIDNLSETIEQYNILITEKEYEIIIAQNREEEQHTKFKMRVRDMEENGIISYLEIVFDSTSFSDFLARIDFVSDIMRADEQAYLDYQRSKAITEAAKDALEETKKELDAELVNMEDLKDELEIQLAEAQSLILEMEADLETQRQLQEKVREDEERVLNEIRIAEAELERQRRAAAAAARAAAAAAAAQQSGSQQGVSTTTGTGQFMWPVNGPVTSPFGSRMHPVYNVMRMHTGIDIGASHGTPIAAADSGTVLTSSYDSTYGNYVVISHGNGWTTLYAHMSTRSVSAGASVSKGQTIGLVGSTGVSTGPHLHFEVINSENTRINPQSVL